MKRRQLTKKQHEELGTNLMVLRNTIQTIGVFVARHRGVNSSAANKLYKAVSFIDAARSELENDFFEANLEDHKSPYYRGYFGPEE